MDQPLTNKERVALEGVSALAGADAALKRLLGGLSMGRPSVETSTYLIKTRIKDHGRLVDKVFDRRKRNLGFRACDVTDILGLRILTLYRSDLPSVVQRFLKFVDQSCAEPLDLFPGKCAQEAVEEVIVYGYPQDQRLCQEIVAQLQQYGLSLDGKRFRHEARANGYSSIHILLRVQVTVGDVPYRVPLEVQIRTVLEDAWGQVEHELIYKSRMHPDAAQNALVNNVRAHLLNWKRLLDTCGDTADTIKEQMKQIFSPMIGGQAMASIGDQALRTLNLQPHLQELIDQAVTRIEKFDEERRDPAKARPVAESINEWIEVAAILQGCIEMLSEADSKGQAFYLLTLELAMCLLWIGKLLRRAVFEPAVMTLVSSGSIEKRLLDARAIPPREGFAHDYPIAMTVLDEAASRYLTLQSDPRYAEDAAIAYRLGEVFWVRDDAQLSLATFETAARHLEKADLPPENPLNVLIPRRLGYAYWEAAETLRHRAKRLAQREFFDSKLLEGYMLAIRQTLQAYEAINRAGQRFFDPGKRDWQVVVNNLLEYCVEYRRLKGSQELLDTLGLTVVKVRALLDELSEHGDLSKVLRPAIADTIRRTSAHFGMPELNRNAARRVLQLLKSRDWSDRYGPEQLAAMTHDAKEDDKEDGEHSNLP